MKPEPVLITDFSNFAAQKWRIVNDDVMGGVSQSWFQINTEGNAVFSGSLSLENSGGFASVRNHESINLSGSRAVRIHLKGDGKRYSFRLSSDSPRQSPPCWYEMRFQTEKERWIEIDLPVDRFQAVRKGRQPDHASELNLRAIGLFGFLISDQQEGDFRLEIQKIETVPKTRT